MASKLRSQGSRRGEYKGEHMVLSKTRDGQNNQAMPDAQTASIQKLSLSEDQWQVVLEYYRLSNQTALSTADIHSIGSTWEKAEKDRKLAQALVTVDNIKPPCLKNERLLSEDKDLRISLSEHTSVIAEERLKQFKGDYGEVDLQKPYVVTICPDGSGFTYRNISNVGEDGLIDVNEIQKEVNGVCQKCNYKAQDHRTFFVFNDKSALPTVG